MASAGRPTTPRAERRAAVRDLLLAAVTHLLRDGASYADVSINAVVAEAGLAKSTFYQYFTGKNDLLNSLIEQVVDNTRARDAWLDFDGPPTPEIVRTTITERVTAYRPFLSVMAAAFDAAYVDAEVRESVSRLMELLNDGLEGHVRRGQEAGWIDSSLPPREIGTWLNWMVSRGLHQMVRGADEQRTAAMIASFSQLIWLVLYAPAA